MYQGKVKKLTDKNYGFITCKDLPKDVFFHMKNLARGVSINELGLGTEVLFDYEDTPRGFNAFEVRPLNS